MRLHNSGQSCIKPRIENLSSSGVSRAKAGNPLRCWNTQWVAGFRQSNRWVAANLARLVRAANGCFRRLMSNSPGNAKLSAGSLMSQFRATVLGILAAIVLLAGATALAAPRHAVMPLPKPRPDAAPKAAEPTEVAPEKSTEAAPPAPAQPSPCRQALTEDIAIAPSLPPIKGPGACGGDDIVRLEAVVLPDKSRVELKPAATLRCTMATAVAEWVRSDLVSLAASLNTEPRTIDNFDSFECRGRNRIAGAMLSEHGKANALDVRSISFADGRELKLTDRTADRTLRETVLHQVCARFSTVLGPDSDWYHEDHVHLDLDRKSTR